ncbi:choice-of-anchor C family protein [Fontisphaera persica]|uniref:choice-of-anchor C family protein n=1 Tax=Fontisphaera persica TaxID=2974023 RepID=UPI0024BFEB73|nr:choice-of-anchor C family protein [Fontisphaera persica]WCJ59534.1 choice-of-anchor C family protein [Fontisphaera persica]
MGWLGTAQLPAQCQNGGFEEPAIPAPYRVFSAGQTLSGWVVESGTVEIVGPYWQAAEGAQSLDLNGIFEQIGTIYQDVPTVPGESYRLRFALSGNPEGGPNNKTLQVHWQNQLLADLTFDTTGFSKTNMGWRYHEFVVTATGSVTRLKFQSTCSSFCGPVLDDISVLSLTATNPPPPPPPHPSGNWGFETPSGIGIYQFFVAGENLAGWTIENGTVEIVGPYWQAAEGSQSLDLNGIFEHIGTIYKDLQTTPGALYRLRFALSGNPEGGPPIKTMKVFWQGELLEELAFDTSGFSKTNMGWRYHEYTLTATGSVTRLKFQSTCPSFCGPVLDDISVTVPGHGTPLMPASTPAPQSPPPAVMLTQPAAASPAAPLLRIYGVTGEVYRIEAAEDPVNGPWITLTNLVLQSSPLLWTDPAGMTAPRRFYRAVLVR